MSTSGPDALHLLTSLYDARMATSRCCLARSDRPLGDPAERLVSRACRTTETQHTARTLTVRTSP